MIIEIEPAELQLQQGDPNKALATLKPVAEHLRSIQDNFFSANYYRLLGDIQWELKKPGEAAVAYQAAIDISEAPLESLQDRGDRIAWLRATDESYRGLVRVLLAQNKVEDALACWEWYKSRPLLRGLRSGGVRVTGVKARSTTNRQSFSPIALPSTPHLVYANFKDGLQI